MAQKGFNTSIYLTHDSERIMLKKMKELGISKSRYVNNLIEKDSKINNESDSNEKPKEIKNESRRETKARSIIEKYEKKR